MAGPPKTPLELKVLAGTDRPDRDGKVDAVGPEPEFEKVAELPNAPQWLNADGAGMWKMLGGQLVRCGVMQSPDLYAFQQLCYAWQRFIAKAKSGEPIPPSEHSNLNALFNAFGVTPSARRRVVRYLTEQPAEKRNKFAGHGTRPA